MRGQEPGSGPFGGQAAGALDLDPRGLAAGVHPARLDAPGLAATRKLVVKR